MRLGLTALAVAAGAAALVVAFAPLDLWPLGLVALGPLWLAVRHARARRAFGLGLLMGALTYAGGFYWVTNTLRDFAAMGWPLTLALLALLCLAGGAAVGLWAVVASVLWRRTALPALLVAPPLWAAVEHLWPTLFPWHLGDSLHGCNTLAQLADLGGMSGLSLLCATAGVGLAETLARLRAGTPRCDALRPAAAAVVALALGAAYGAWRGADVAAQAAVAPRATVGVVQGNIGIYDKERVGLAERNTRQFLALSHDLVARGAELVVWPETTVQEPVWLGQPVAPPYVRLAAPLLTGGLAARQEGPRLEWYNVAYLVERGVVRGLVPKNRLLLFGEYLPFERLVPGLRRLFPHAGALTPGRTSQTLVSGRARIGVLICYEDVLPAFARAVAAQAPAPNLLVNVTNDSWFGRSTEPYEHAYLASFRAIELRRSLVRATNTGLSCLIDPRGRMIARGGLFQAETLIAAVPLLEGQTVYARLGDWPALAGIAAGLGLAALAFARRRRAPVEPS
ncbi:MAG TPA: apolipoprotein N-acyltransferase [Polyangia bacterium]|jgi:apolipoprotein N-acyltransferase